LTLRAGPPLVLSGVPSALTEPNDAATDRVWVSLKKVGALMPQIGNGRALAGGEFVLMYSTTGAGGSFVDLGPSVPLDTIRYPAVGDPTAPAAGAVSPDRVCLSWGVRGGDGTAASVAEITNIYVVATSATPPAAPEPPADGEPPTGPPFGNLLLDLNVASLTGFVQDDLVEDWADDATADGAQSAFNAPGSPIPLQQLPLFYQEDAFGAGFDAVRITGADTGLVFPNPWEDSWTYYLVVRLVDSDDSGILLNTTGDAGSNFVIAAQSGGTFSAGVNRSAFDNNVLTTSSGYFDGNAHILRFVWRRAPGHWWLYVDGTLVLDNAVVSTALQNLVDYVILGGRIGGTAQLEAYLGRVLQYDTPHIGSTGDPVEAVLRTQFGL
jgi:hypothetical protein